MTREELERKYFKWLFDTVCEGRYAKAISYKNLLTQLHDIIFVYLIPNDKNRAEDGIDLRYRFAITECRGERIDYILNVLDGPCSVLEMMVALSIRCEENIMDDPHIGNRTGQWFWGMIKNLGLSTMIDSRYDGQYVEEKVGRFLNRDYEPNGKGGLFTIKDCDYDLRNIEIWFQLNWYLDSIV